MRGIEGQNEAVRFIELVGEETEECPTDERRNAIL